jgi:hypothetical protein
MRRRPAAARARTGVAIREDHQDARTQSLAALLVQERSRRVTAARRKGTGVADAERNRRGVISRTPGSVVPMG